MSGDQTVDQSEIIAALMSLLGELTAVELTPQTDLVNDLALESVQIMAFVTDVEDHFDIAIELESLADVHRVDELAEVVAKALHSA
ncbi:MAG: acyl carrier protein [Pseudomonadales bacterium]